MFKRKNSQDETWTQNSGYSKFSIKAFWKEFHSFLWTPENISWPKNNNVMANQEKSKSATVYLVLKLMEKNYMKKRSIMMIAQKKGFYTLPYLRIVTVGMMSFFFKILFIFQEREREGERGRETSTCGCLLHIPHWGPGPQPRHVPWLGIEPETL